MSNNSLGLRKILLALISVSICAASAHADEKKTSAKGKRKEVTIFQMSGDPVYDETGIVRIHERKFEIDTRLYMPTGPVTNGLQDWGSVLVPKGMTLKTGGGALRKFRDGYEYLDDVERISEAFPSLERHMADGSGGQNRLLFLDFGWDDSKYYSEKSDEELKRLVKGRAWETSRYQILREGEYEFPDTYGYFTVTKLKDVREDYQDLWSKRIQVLSRKFGATIVYIERDPATGKSLDPADWKYESVADDLLKTFKFEKFPASTAGAVLKKPKRK